MMTKRHQLTQALLFLALLLAAQYGTSVSAEHTAVAGINSNVAAGTSDENGHDLQRNLDDCGCGDCSFAISAVLAAQDAIVDAQEVVDELNLKFDLYETFRDNASEKADETSIELDQALNDLLDAIHLDDKKSIKAAKKAVKEARRSLNTWLKKVKIGEGKIRKNIKKVKKAEQEVEKAENYKRIMDKSLNGCFKKLDKCNRKCANGKI